jgi:hypothetical protein
MKNPFAKTRKVSKAYATFQRAAWEWRVLKTYQLPQNENKNRYARWLVAAKSPHTFGSWEIGDTYVKDLLAIPGIRMIQADEEFKDAYRPYTSAASSFLPAGVQVISLDDPATMHNALAKVFGE